MLFVKDGRYVELTDPVHIDAFMARGWEKAVNKSENVQREPEEPKAPKAPAKRGRPAKR